jgi:hypothetical protein
VAPQIFENNRAQLQSTPILAQGLGTARASSSPGRINTDDRQVFALVWLKTLAVQPLEASCYFATLSGAPPKRWGPLVRAASPARGPLDWSWFRQAKLKVEFLRKWVPVQATLVVVVDLKRLNDNKDETDANPLPPVNPEDGVVAFVLSYRESPGANPGDPPTYRIGGEVVSDPDDLDGMAVIDKPKFVASALLRAVAGAAILMPAVIAAGRDQINSLAAGGAGLVGGGLLTTPIASQDPVINPERLILRGVRGAVSIRGGGWAGLRLGIDYQV